MNDSVILWLTKDNEGTNLWKKRPRLCAANDLFFNGGETLTLPEGSFPHLRKGSIVRVEVKQLP